MTHSPLLTLALTACYITGCAYGGLKPADTWVKEPKAQKRCVIVTDGRHAACLEEEAYQRWLQRNNL